MEKVDAVVALVGALVLVAAVGVAALQEDPQYPAYLVTPQLTTESLDADLGTHQPGQAFRAEAPFDLDRSGLHRVSFNVTLVPTGGFLSAGSAHVTVTAPNGTTYEDEMDVPQGATPVVIPLLVDVAPLPAPRSVTVVTEADRDAAIAAMESWEGAGNWTVAVDYAPGPVPSPRVDASVEVSILRWVPTGGPEPPATSPK